MYSKRSILPWWRWGFPAPAPVRPCTCPAAPAKNILPHTLPGLMLMYGVQRRARAGKQPLHAIQRSPQIFAPANRKGKRVSSGPLLSLRTLHCFTKTKGDTVIATGLVPTRPTQHALDRPTLECALSRDYELELVRGNKADELPLRHRNLRLRTNGRSISVSNAQKHARASLLCQTATGRLPGLQPS